MTCVRFLRASSALAGLLFTLAATAQTADYDVVFDLDRDEATGCSITTSGGATVAGIEARLQATVDTATQTVVDVVLLQCDGTDFSIDSTLGGGYPAALNEGVDGADVVEMTVGQFQAAGSTNGLIRLGFLADDGEGSDILITTDGSASGGSILLGIPFAIPGLTIVGLLLLATLLVVAAWFVGRRSGHFMVVSAVMLVALAAWASQHAADGDLGEWEGIEPAAIDPAGDATNGSAALDLVAAFAVREGHTLFFRIDVTDLENQAPEADDDSYTTDEDTALSVAAPGVLDNDSDPEGDAISAVLDSGPASAESFTLGADGSFDYVPEADFDGEDSFSYFANDGQSDSQPATVTISVEGINDPPETVGDSATTLEDEPVEIDVLANDSDVDGNLDPASVTVVTAPDNGTTSVDSSTGSITYTKAGDFNGEDSFVYEVCDDGTPTPPECATATVTVTVEGVNDPPTFTPGADISVVEDSGDYAAAWASDIDPGAPDEGDQTLTFAVTANDNPGLFADGPSLDAGGNLSFTPADDANGSASITVELSDDGGTDNGGEDTSGPATFAITVEPVNDAPSFTPGGDVSVREDSGDYSAAWATGLSAGPPDESGQNLSFAVTGNDNAALFADGPNIDSAGNLSFTPAADAFGTANVTVELSDDGGTGNGGEDTSAPVTFSITLEPVNDAPSFTPGGDVTVDEDSGAYDSAWAGDIDPGAPNETGQALTFNITANDNPGLFSAGPAIDASGNLGFTPAADANGTASITVELADGGGTANGGVDTSAPAQFTIIVEAVNDPPVVNAPGPFDVTGNIRIQVPDGADDLLSDVSDPGDGGAGAPFTITAGNVTSAEGGNVIVNADGSFTYDPPAGHEGDDSFEYQVCDSGEPLPPACTTASVSLSVSDMIWFVDPAAAAGGDGRLSRPFREIDDLDAVNDGNGNNPAAGQPIFLFGGTHDGQLALLDGQQLFGEGASQSLAAMTGLVLPSYSDGLPPTGGAAPNLTAINGTALTVAVDNVLRGFEIGDTADGTDLAGSNFGTLTVSEVELSGGGQALDLVNGTLADGAGSPGFTAISSSGGSRNISLVDVDGTPTLGGGSLTGATAAGVYIDGGTGSLVYPGTVSHDDGRIVDIQNRGSGTVELSGNLSASGGLGIRIIGNSGGSIILSGTTKAISNTTVDAISLSGNAGAEVNFTNGGLDVTTSGGLDGLFASGGGTLSISGAGNRIDAGSGSAVKIVDTVIGATGITLERVTSNGSDIGIELQNTGTAGDFVVTGNGGPCTGATPTCSGGRIQSTVGVDGAAAGNGIRLDNTGRVELNRMRIDNHPNHAVLGANVDGFALIDSVVDGSNGDSLSPEREGAIVFANLTGSAGITRSEISGGLTENLRVRNDSGVLDRLVIEDSVISDNSAADGNKGIHIMANDQAEMNVTVSNSVLAAHRSDHFDGQASGNALMDVVFTANTMTGGHPSPVGQSVLLSGADSSIVTFDVNDNVIDGAIVSAFTFFQGSSTTPSSSMSGMFSGNEIGLAGVQGSGSLQGNGVTFNATGSGTLTTLIDNNVIRQWSNLYGLLVQAGDESPTVNATISNNTLAEPNTNAFPANGLHLNAGTTAAGAVSACADIVNNSLAGSGALGSDDFRLRQRNDSTVSLPGYGGGATDTAAVVGFVEGNNAGNPSGSAAANGSGGGFTGAAACPMP